MRVWAYALRTGSSAACARLERPSAVRSWPNRWGGFECYAEWGRELRPAHFRFMGSNYSKGVSRQHSCGIVHEKMVRYGFEYPFRDLTQFTTGYFFPFSSTKLYFSTHACSSSNIFPGRAGCVTLEALRSMGIRRTRSLPLGESS
jgi:hypothetical protein